jgi:uncharacterized membrane protein YdjX (TVP38/TMEM64 family)
MGRTHSARASRPQTLVFADTHAHVDDRANADQRPAQRREVTAVAGARLLPGPFGELNMLVGLTSLKLRDFLIGTFIGGVPKTLAWSVSALFSSSWFGRRQIRGR